MKGAGIFLCGAFAVSCLVCAAPAGQALAQPIEPLAMQWVKDPKSGCSVWTFAAVADWTLNWNGPPCPDGKAEGAGKLEFHGAGPDNHFVLEATFRNGKAEGPGTYVYDFGKLHVSFVDGMEKGPFTVEIGRYDPVLRAHAAGTIDGNRVSFSGTAQLRNGEYRLRGEAVTGEGGWGASVASDIIVVAKLAMIFPDGTKYEGEVTNTGRLWQGVLEWPDGERYAGEVKNLTMSGYGVHTFPNGWRYRGAFSDGIEAGHGVLEWRDGSRYSGQFLSGLPSGYGVLERSNGNRHEGFFLNGKPSGNGRSVTAAGDRFEGTFVDGKLQGWATMVSAAGDRYEGEVVDNRPHGKGTYAWSDGHRYEGDFLDGSRTGKGVYTWPDGGRYVGEFVGGRRNGKGVLVWPSGRRYEGEFLNGEITGNGVYFNAEGNRVPEGAPNR